MAKRIVVGLLVLAAVGGVLAAQEAPEGQAATGTAKIAVGLDLFPLAKGIIWTDNDADNSLFALTPAFEYLVAPHFTVGAVVDLYFGQASDIDILYFGLAAHGRWYPLSSGPDKLFVDTGLGFNVFALDGETDSKKGGFAGLTMSLKAGYKLMLTSKFFIEPSMAFVYAKIPGVGVRTPLGWQPGLSIGGAL
ncbi:MAG: autotransporter outer membrane beta-barrel domain-containing protein [Treponema sp.]|jgi:hypothetical protein|nr:autotransporter outer membrane beta-barrel domain-containing protein [Treponema sp.]